MMLIPLLLGGLSEPKWTGEVQAFALYLTPRCLPQERMNTVYVARKTYADGSTSTVVRAVPAETPIARRLQNVGIGRIERNPQGLPMRIARQSVDTEQGRSMTFGTTDLATRRSERLETGEIKLGPLDHRPFHPETDYVIDPLEWLAFGPPKGGDDHWHIPAVDEAGEARGWSFLYEFHPPFASTRMLGNRRETFSVVQLTRWISSKNPPPRRIQAGNLWYHGDGSLAVFAEVPDMSVYPSMTSAQIGRVSGNPDPFAEGYYVPTTVSASERNAILAGV